MTDPVPATPASPSVPGGMSMPIAASGMTPVAAKPGPAVPVKPATITGTDLPKPAPAKVSTGPVPPKPTTTVPPTTVQPTLDRARVEPVARKTDGLPLLYALGAIVLLAAGWYVYTHPPGGAQGEDFAAKFDALNTRTAALEQRSSVDLAPVQKQVAAVEARLTSLEQKPVTAPTDAAVATSSDTPSGDVASRLSALDRRVAAAEQGVAQVDTKIDGKVRPLDARVAAADAKLGQVGATVDAAIASKLAAAEAATTARVNQIGSQLGAQVDAKVGALTDTSRKFAQAQAAMAAMEGGQKLGIIAGAPPALTRYADTAPPTDFALKQAFSAAAAAATRASVPDAGGERPFLDRLWSRAQQSISLREGDRVLVGDPVTGTLAQARRALDGNDLGAALAALQGLSGPPRAAMNDWIGQAQGVLDARAALAQMARG